jgi:hypothetical protein
VTAPRFLGAFFVANFQASERSDAYASIILMDMEGQSKNGLALFC